MYSSNIFPPIFNQTYIPAFLYDQSCRIYFSLSKYNSINFLNLNAVQVVVRNQKTNVSVLNPVEYPSGIKITTLGIDPLKDKDDKYYIQINTSDITGGFKLNEYYKVQIRFTENDAEDPPADNRIDNWLNTNLNYFSEWSRVVLIRGISNPILNLKDYSNLNDTISIHTTDLDLKGNITFSVEEDNQTLQSYSIKLYKENQLLEDSGNIYSLNNEIQYSVKRVLEVGSTYTVQVQIITQNLYSWPNSKNITFYVESQSEPVMDINIECISSNRTGCIKLLLYNKYDTTYEENYLSDGVTLVIKRSSSKNDFTTEEQVASFTLAGAGINNILWLDYTIQPGVWYKYNIIRYNISGERTASVKILQPLMVHSEDIFLSGEGKQLNIRFDPDVSNFSITTSEALIQTIGSKYPFIRRNGNVNYKTFSLSGTISCMIDLESNLMKASKQDIYKESKSLYDQYNADKGITLFRDDIYERMFREKVIEFLEKNNVKLFRSITQGNILVKLMNINFTPNKQINRQIYSFSCTAYEIAECNIENYKKYKIFDINQIKYNVPVGGDE